MTDFPSSKEGEECKTIAREQFCSMSDLLFYPFGFVTAVQAQRITYLLAADLLCSPEDTREPSSCRPLSEEIPIGKSVQSVFKGGLVLKLQTAFSDKRLGTIASFSHSSITGFKTVFCVQ